MASEDSAKNCDSIRKRYFLRYHRRTLTSLVYTLTKRQSSLQSAITFISLPGVGISSSMDTADLPGCVASHGWVHGSGSTGSFLECVYIFYKLFRCSNRCCSNLKSQWSNRRLCVGNSTKTYERFSGCSEFTLFASHWPKIGLNNY